MISQNSSSIEKLAALRNEMQRFGVDGFLVPRTDRYQNESVPFYAERLHFISNFSGSAGLGFVSQDRAVLFTDGRYTVQAAYECDQDLFEILDSTQVKFEDFLAEQGGVIGYDPWLLTCDQVANLSARHVDLKAVPENFIDLIWHDQPLEPQDKREIFPDDIAGQSSADKIASLSLSMDVDAMLITSPTSVAWLLNQRGCIVPNTPALCAYGLLMAGEFIELQAPYDFSFLAGKTVGLDFKRTPVWFQNALEDVDAEILNVADPCLMPRACKTVSEQEAIGRAHVRDGVALVRFLCWLDQNAVGQTELDIMEMLEAFRARDEAYRGASFETIAGFGANGAIIHYHSTPDTNKVIEEGSFLLIDSGGQYGRGDVWGTTDITRTIAIGDVPDALKAHYTRVLMGHIDLAMAAFDGATTGKDLDVYARQPLLEVGLDYAHGTGHGVGCYLSVHEEAALGISHRATEPLRAGMLVSNEPGYYEEGSHGIRIENLVFVQPDGDGLRFETVSLAPIDMSCVVFDMMNDAQKAWLQDYHARVFETLSPFLDDVEKEWLGRFKD